MSGLEVTGEAGRAGLYAILGGAFLKFFELILAAFDRKRAKVDDEAVLAARIREELRKDNEDLRTREDSLELRMASLYEELHACRAKGLSLEIENRELRAAKDEAEADLRAWKRGLRSPHSPTTAGDP